MLICVCVSVQKLINYCSDIDVNLVGICYDEPWKKWSDFGAI